MPWAPPGGAGGGVWGEGRLGVSAESAAPATRSRISGRRRLADLYRSSPALGRFFSEAETFGLRSDSAVVQYKLTFVYPEEQQAELRNFTLSSEMVFNVFRQFLYDQSDVESEILFVDPSSLKMYTMH
ncbi:hypothetical protein ILYODFUR_026637 [Ilyodon furcidens]|uniref:Uncharacterized protein n=1 Tax=Ilyodon furcidens TaxID=33524 RepID=A0ABV0UYN5_9TELE